MRQSLIAQLKSFQSFGIEDVLPPKNLSTTKNPSPCPSPTRGEGTLKLETAMNLDELRAHIGDCTRCRLCEHRTNLVFGVGNERAELMFVGEGPGADEDAQGIPFVGRAGQLLTKIIEAMGYKREDVYIGNLIKCRPPNNRNPELDEIALCLPFLKKQIELIKPLVIICLGKFAAQTLLNSQMPISRLRGNFYDVDGIAVMPTFHPAYLLRNPEMKRPLWEDCKKVMAKLKALRA